YQNNTIHYIYVDISSCSTFVATASHQGPWAALSTVPPQHLQLFLKTFFTNNYQHVSLLLLQPRGL
ncbi:hypothetical protein, partial [Antiquaquibacter soli]